MSQINTREIVLLGLTTATTNGTGPDINLVQAFQASIVNILVSTASGTSPTLNVFVQRKLTQAAAADAAGAFPTGASIYDDLLAFTTLTTTGTQIGPFCTGGFAPAAPATVASNAIGVDYLTKSAALTASTYRIGPLGGMWRVAYNIAGTSPSFSFSIVAQFIPYST